MFLISVNLEPLTNASFLVCYGLIGQVNHDLCLRIFCYAVEQIGKKQILYNDGKKKNITVFVVLFAGKHDAEHDSKAIASYRPGCVFTA